MGKGNPIRDRHGFIVLEWLHRGSSPSTKKKGKVDLTEVPAQKIIPSWVDKLFIKDSLYQKIKGPSYYYKGLSKLPVNRHFTTTLNIPGLGDCKVLLPEGFTISCEQQEHNYSIKFTLCYKDYSTNFIIFFSSNLKQTSMTEAIEYINKRINMGVNVIRDLESKDAAHKEVAAPTYAKYGSTSSKAVFAHCTKCGGAYTVIAAYEPQGLCAVCKLLNEMNKMNEIKEKVAVTLAAKGLELLDGDDDS